MSKIHRHYLHFSFQFLTHFWLYIFNHFWVYFFFIFEPKFLTINSKFLTFLCGTFWRCGNRCFLEDWRNIRMYMRVIGFQQDPPFIRGRSQNLFSKLLHCLLLIKFYHFPKLFSNEENGIKLFWFSFYAKTFDYFWQINVQNCFSLKKKLVSETQYCYRLHNYIIIKSKLTF